MIPAKDLDPAFGNWLAGFIDGEGSFNIGYLPKQDTYQCRMTIVIRDDDLDVLEQAVAFSGVGTLSFCDYHAKMQGNANPHARWLVTTRSGCLRIVELLDRFPLRAKKAKDYAIWREAVIEWNGRRGRGNLGRLPELKVALEAARKYPAGRVPEPTPPDPQLVLG